MDKSKAAKQKGKKGKWESKDKTDKPKVSKERSKERISDIVRLAETNIDGNLKVKEGMKKIKGVSFMMANAISHVSKMGEIKINEMSEEQVTKLEDMISNPQNYNVPVWMLNRKSDPQSGKDVHLIVSNLDLTLKMDINEMKKLKTYKGMRHAWGLPVRGQRTRSSFRKGKSVGVVKKKQQPAKGGKKK